MTVALKNGSIVLVGTCEVGEAETLVSLIQSNPGAIVDVSEAGAVHTALWQVMLALSPTVIGEARDPVVRQWLAPHFGRKAGDAPT